MSLDGFIAGPNERDLGGGRRSCYDVASGSMRKLPNLVGDDPNAATNLRFRTSYEN